MVSVISLNNLSSVPIEISAPVSEPTLIVSSSLEPVAVRLKFHSEESAVVFGSMESVIVIFFALNEALFET